MEPIGAREICIQLFEEHGIPWQFIPFWDGRQQRGALAGAIKNTHNNISTLGLRWHYYEGNKYRQSGCELNIYWFMKRIGEPIFKIDQAVINLLGDPMAFDRVVKIVKAYVSDSITKATMQEESSHIQRTALEMPHYKGGILPYSKIRYETRSVILRI